jgi:Mrp family chromosome partitioning ATPase
MSISDQAFIRAYHEESSTAGIAPVAAIDIGLGSVIPPPHAKFPESAAKAKQASIGTQADAESQAKSTLPKTDPVDGADKPPSRSEKRRPSLDESAKATLSSLLGLAAAPTPSAVSAGPALEVDAVVWPPICETLLARYGERFDRMAVELCREAGSGQKTTAITGIRRGEGRTTLALCLARRLAAGHAKVVLVDADFSNPSMAAQLCIDIDRGWEAVLDDTETVWDVMIESAADRFALLPLGAGIGNYEMPAPFRIAAVLGELAEHYDLVLVDAGPISPETPASQWLLESDTNVHSVILAHDVRHTKAHQLAAGCVQLAEVKRRQLGIAEIFVADEVVARR